MNIEINTIPEMVHPLGRHWQQPNLHNILIDDVHAMMSEYSLSELHEYSMSIPSAVYEGKMWKAYNRNSDTWYLRWFSIENEDGLLPIYSRKILLCDYGEST